MAKNRERNVPRMAVPLVQREAPCVDSKAPITSWGTVGRIQSHHPSQDFQTLRCVLLKFLKKNTHRRRAIVVWVDRTCDEGRRLPLADGMVQSYTVC